MCKAFKYSTGTGIGLARGGIFFYNEQNVYINFKFQTFILLQSYEKL